MGSRFNLIVQDLSGLGVKQSGYTSSKLIEYLATRVEAKLIKSATSVSCISIPIKNFVENISPSSNTVYIPNYPLRDIDFILLINCCKSFQHKFFSESLQYSSLLYFFCDLLCW